jgi:hypothetical protein
MRFFYDWDDKKAILPYKKFIAYYWCDFKTLYQFKSIHWKAYFYDGMITCWYEFPHIDENWNMAGDRMTACDPTDDDEGNYCNQ